MRAIGMVEFNSIAKGIYAADQMAKISEVEFAAATSTCPGKYIAAITASNASANTELRLLPPVASSPFPKSR